MPDRSQEIEAFLRSAGWETAEQDPLDGDASFRRYIRLRRKGESAMLMDAPPPQENVAPFHLIDHCLCALGLSAPRILAADQARGFLLLDDFGDRTFTRALAEGADEPELYRLATDVLIALQQRWAAHEPQPAERSIPPYDESRLLEEAVLLTDWYMPELHGRPAGAALRESYLEEWRKVLPKAFQVPETLVLRDYHVDNLMLLADRKGIAACGLLDFQDAVIGPASYDLASLIADARRDVSPAVAAEMTDRFLQAFPAIDPEGFQRSLAILTAQRSAKIIGIFTRLFRRDGKPGYLKHIPRTWRLLEQALVHPELSALRQWFDKELPAAERIAPAADRPAPDRPAPAGDAA